MGQVVSLVLFVSRTSFLVMSQCRIRTCLRQLGCESSQPILVLGPDSQRNKCLIFFHMKEFCSVQKLMLFLSELHQPNNRSTRKISTSLPFSLSLSKATLNRQVRIFDMPTININTNSIITLLSTSFTVQHVIKAFFAIFRNREDERLSERILVETFGGRNKNKQSSWYCAEINPSFFCMLT